MKSIISPSTWFYSLSSSGGLRLTLTMSGTGIGSILTITGIGTGIGSGLGITGMGTGI